MSPKRPEQNRTKNAATMLRMHDEDKAALHALAAHLGISMADVVTLLVRKEIRREGIKVLPLEHYMP